jgi:endothelin-converting enzyme
VYGSFNEVADRNKKIILKVLDSIPDKSGDDVGIATTAEPFSAEEANRRKLKAVYTSCLDVQNLDEQGVKPLLPLVQRTLDIMGPFDALPPKGDDEEGEGVVTVDAAYELPEHLKVAAARAQDAKRGQRAMGPADKEKKVVHALQEVASKNHKRQDKITEALAYLHSRGELSLGYLRMAANNQVSMR